MAIVGFIFLFVVGFLFSCFYLIICVQALLTYDIPTPWQGKVALLLIGAAIVYGWVLLFEYSPFTLNLAV